MNGPRHSSTRTKLRVGGIYDCLDVVLLDNISLSEFNRDVCLSVLHDTERFATETSSTKGYALNPEVRRLFVFLERVWLDLNIFRLVLLTGRMTLDCSVFDCSLSRRAADKGVESVHIWERRHFLVVPAFENSSLFLQSAVDRPLHTVSMTVDTIMKDEVVTIPPATTLSDIRSHLHDGGFRHLLVVDEGTLVGVISDRDVLRTLSPFLDAHSEEHREVRTLARPAREIMRKDPITIAPDTKIEDASSLLLDHNVSSLPVISGDGLVGIVTTKELLRHYTEET